MSAEHENQPNIVDNEGSSVPVFTEEDGNVAAALSEEKSVAPVAAASSSSSSSSSSSPRQIVEVEEDPAMKEQLEEQAAKIDEIHKFRSQMKDFTDANSEDELVRQFLDSDRVVYRFLKARKFDAIKSKQLFEDAVKMRADRNLNGVLSRPCPKGLEYKIFSKHGWHGFDKYGRPVFIKNTGLQHFPTLFSVGDLKERVNYNTYLNEYLRQVIIPEANARIGHKYPIDQVVTIVNLKNFGFHCIKKHNYDWVQEIALINNTLYPETAGSTWIINAPRVFSMVWSVVKGWIDERTRSKVQILSGDGSEEIRRVLGEEVFQNLPKEIGGECQCMPPDQVPEHGMGCMLGHPMSVAFIEHLKKRNTEAGIPNIFIPIDEAKLKDQEEDHREESKA